jgi:hypothetical protein
MSTPPVDSRYLPSFEQQFDEGRSQEFQILKLLRAIHTATIVQIQTVTPISASVGVVTVIPMIEDTTTGGLVLAQSPIYSVPYFRLQGGTSAVIIDPVPNDIGLAVFAERDISAVVQTLKAGPPPTARSHSSADGLYLGGFLNGAPVQWVKFLPAGAGIDISTPGALTLEGKTIALTAGQSVTITAGTTAEISAPTSITLACGTETFTLAPAGAVSTLPITAPDVVLPRGSVNGHIHGGVTTGSGNTGTYTG